MHQSGHSRAHSMQTVQFSSSSAITPRERGGRSGSTSGYCWVVRPPGQRLERDGEPLDQALAGRAGIAVSLTTHILPRRSA